MISRDRWPTNIRIDLFKGDPTKDHKGWLVEVSFTHPDTSKQVRVAEGTVYKTPELALFDTTFLIDGRLGAAEGKH